MIAGLLLAAGSASRFGGNKLAATIGDGVPMVVRTARTLRLAVDKRFAIVRPSDEVLSALLQNEGVTIVPCAAAVSGIGFSIGCGVRAARRAAGWVVVLGDMPFVSEATIIEVGRRLRAGAEIVAPTYRGKRGHPVGFSAAFGPALEILEGDEGGRRLIAEHADRLVTFACDDPGIVRDIDVPSDVDGDPFS